MKELQPKVDLVKEAQAVTDYIHAKWTPIEGLNLLVQELAEAANKHARIRVKHHDIWKLVHVKMAERKALLTSLGHEPNAEWYDAGWHLLHQLGSAAQIVQDAVRLDPRWDYSEVASSLWRSALSAYPSLAISKPHGWDELAKGYTEFDGQAEYDARPDRALFKGCDTGEQGAHDFVARTALPYVMYDDVAQGRAPSRVLVAAIFSHFLEVCIRNNTLGILQELEGLAEGLPGELVYECAPEFKHPLLRVCYSEASAPYTREAHEKSIAARAAFARLSPQEQAATVEENQRRTRERLNELLSRVDQDVHKNDAKNARILARIDKELA